MQQLLNPSSIKTAHLLAFFLLYFLSSQEVEAGKCKSNSCTNPALAKCINVSGRATCIPCQSDSDCTKIGAGRTCETWGSRRILRGCSRNPLCQTSGSYTPAYCAACTSTSQCTGGKLCINYECTTCSSDYQCYSNDPTKPYCDSGQCVACKTNAECLDPANSRCDPTAKVCGPCQSPSDCTTFSASFLTLCDTTTGCYQCDTSNPCTVAGETCDAGICKPSCGTTQSICDPYTYLPQCGTSGYCDPCDDAFCQLSSKVCLKDGSCQECLVDSDCTDPTQSQCSGNVCVPCNSDTQCAHITNSNTCDSGVCAQCATSDDCGDLSNARCVSQTCTGCQYHDDCTHFGTPTTSSLYLCFNTVCSLEGNLKIQLVSTLASETYYITIPSALVSGVNVISNLDFTFDGYDSSTFSFKVTKVSSTQYSVTFTTTMTINPTTLTAIYTPFASSTGATTLASLQWTSQLTSTTINFIPESQKQTVTAMKGVAQAATTAMTAASGAMIALGGNPIILWALLNLLQSLYYLIFINVNYPINVHIFLEIFQIGGLSFIPNPMEWIFPEIGETTLPSPTKFETYDVDGLFLNNAGNMLLVWVIVFGLYLIAKVANRYFRFMTKLMSMASTKTVEWFEWSGILRALITSYPELIQSAFLQIRVMEFGSAMFITSTVLALLFVGFSVIFPFALFFIIKIVSKNPRRLKFKYTTIVEGFNIHDTVAKYFNVICLARRLVVMASLVFLHDYPYLEIFLMTLSSFLVVALIIKYMPYETKRDNICNLLIEVIFAIVHILIFVLIFDDDHLNFTGDTRVNIGWILVGGCGGILLICLGSALVEQVKVVKAALIAFNKLRKKEMKSKLSRVAHKMPQAKEVAPQPLPDYSPSLTSKVDISQIDTGRDELVSSFNAFQPQKRNTRRVVPTSVFTTQDLDRSGGF